MNKNHRVSGVYLSLFVTAHLLNHLTALHHINSHIAVMDVLRGIYKHPLVEFGLIVAVLFQIGSGLGLAFRSYKIAKKREQPVAKNPWKRWQIYSGLYLAFFLLVHTSATLFAHYGMGVDTNFYFAAMVVQVIPQAFFFVPYYFLGVASYFVHLVCLWRLFKGNEKKANRPAWIGIGVGILIAVLILVALEQPMELPSAYQSLLEK